MNNSGRAGAMKPEENFNLGRGYKMEEKMTDEEKRRCKEYYEKVKKDGNFCDLPASVVQEILRYINHCEVNKISFDTLSFGAWRNQSKEAAKKITLALSEEVKEPKYLHYVVEQPEENEELIKKNTMVCESCGKKYLTYYARNWNKFNLSGWLCMSCFKDKTGEKPEIIPFKFDASDFTPDFHTFGDEKLDQELLQDWFEDWDAFVHYSNPGYGFIKAFNEKEENKNEQERVHQKTRKRSL